jgi:beta-galactosidase
MLVSPIRPTVWRAPTDNDRYVQQKWREAGLDTAESVCSKTEAKHSGDGTLSVVSSIKLGKFLKLKITYTFDNGSLTVKTAVTNNSPVFLPKFGYEAVMPENSEQYSYFGCGPYESYEDKHLASKMGLFVGNVSDNIEHYIFPQENCSHYKTSFATIKSVAGHGLRFECDDTFTFRASHFSTEMLDTAKHDYELSPAKETYVYIDYKQSGIGSNSCGPELAKKYRLDDEKFTFTFKVTPTK